MSNAPIPPTPPFLQRIWPTVIPILAVLGIPTVGVTYYLTRYPLLSLGIFLLYELGVFVIGFLGTVWGKLEEPLAEHVAAWLKQWAIILLSRYHRQYYRYLHYQHRDFDVKGLSTLGTYTLELDQVFVDLRIDPSTPRTASGSSVQVPHALSSEAHSLWSHLTSPSLKQLHLIVIGPPGSGKTTLLKHVVLGLTTKRTLFHRRQQPNLPGKMPILLFLRDHVQAITEQEHYTLVNAIQDHLSKWEEPHPPEGWFQRQLRRGRCLVMLDGLDEVADLQARQKVVEWVERQMTSSRGNRFLVTSRPFGYRSNPLPNVAVLEVRPFTSEQVERFVHQWYLAIEIMSKQKDDPGVRMRARDDAKALLQRLRTTPEIFDLTVNPLLLTMIATIHRYGGELPGNRCALYAEMCEVFLGKRQQARGQSLEFTPAQTQAVLESLAYAMMVQGKRDIACDEVQRVIEESLRWMSTTVSPETFLQTVENISGLFLERENGVYSFAHLTFQEFLAACYLKEKQQGQLLVTHVGESWWRETIRLYCSMEDATFILEACLQGEHPQAFAIELAIDCDKEARKVRPETRARVEMLIKMGVEHADPERQHVIAHALLARRLRHMVHLKGETYVDISLITCAEYQVFLDEKREQGIYVQPDHWTSYRFTPDCGNLPVLGVRRADAQAFCTWLTERDGAAWSYRLPQKEEAEQEGSLLCGLPTNVGYWLHNEKELFWVDTPLMLPDPLLQEVPNLFPDTYISRSLALDLDRNLGRIRTLVHDLDNVFIFARVLTHDTESTLASLRDLALQYRPLARALNRSLAIERVIANERTRTRALIPDLGLARDLARTFPLDCALDRAYALSLKDANGSCLDRHRLSDSLHIRLLMLDLIMVIYQVYILYFSFSSKQTPILFPATLPSLLHYPSRAEKEDRRVADQLYKMYLDLFILKKRIQGELQPCEGILLVKERK